MTQSERPFCFTVWRGADILSLLDELGELRIRVFREYPYRYEGSLKYERQYLQYYVQSPDGLVLTVRNAAGELVGAATGLPASAAWSDDSLKVFGDDAYYWGEFILDHDYRGKGLGSHLYHRMMNEIHALGYTRIGMYMIVTQPNDPAKPVDYLEMTDFALNHGYERIPGAVSEWEWIPIGGTDPVPHRLQAWIKKV